MCRRGIQAGFTIVETMLSVAFISILLIAVGTISLHTVRTYHKGVTVKTVNEIGYAVGDDLKRSISAGGVSLNSTPSDYFTNDNYGVLCTGVYSYVWNYANSLKTKNTKVIRYKEYLSDTTNLGGDESKIRMVKVLDRTRYFCSIAADYSKINGSIHSPKSPAAVANRAIEIIKPSDGDLMMYDFHIAQGARDSQTGYSIYNASFSLGTFMDKYMIKDAQCVTDGSLLSGVESSAAGLHDYCAINKFNISILARER